MNAYDLVWVKAIMILPVHADVFCLVVCSVGKIAQQLSWILSKLKLIIRCTSTAETLGVNPIQGGNYNQAISFKKKKTGYNSISFIHIELNYGVVVVEHNLQHIFIEQHNEWYFC